ncbi:MAG: benzoate-CoA ligase family protein [Myxococcota bacterium]
MEGENNRLKIPGKPLNLADRFLDHNLRAGRGQKVAVVEDGPDGVHRYTYQEVSERANRYGRVFQTLGLRLEDRILLVLPDGIDWVAAFFGALKAGCTAVFVSPQVSAEELAFYLRDSRARSVVLNEEGTKKLVDPDGSQTVPCNVEDPAFRAMLNEMPSTLEAAPTLEEDFAIWLYSSGSTGSPKAAVHRAHDFVYNTERYARNVLRLSDEDVTVSVPKLFFGYATGANLLFPFYFGGTTVLFPDRPHPDRLFELVERHRASVLINVPTMIARMVEAHEAEPRDISSLRILTSAGEALPPELYRRWIRATGVEILDGIGSAEMFHVFISARAGEVVPGSLGTLVDGYEARIVGPNGEDLPDGEVGSLWVRGGSAAAFYWQRMHRSREVLRGEWVVTGDLFRRRSDGHFFYQGRADDLMKVSGQWVSPQEIEDALTRHPAVAEAGVARWESEGLTKPIAFVVVRSGVAAEDVLASTLQDHVADTLVPFKAPRRVFFVGALPRGDRDKLDRAALARWARERSSSRQEPAS